MSIVQVEIPPSSRTSYAPRGRNTLKIICEKHFQDFCNAYEESYAERYGKFRLERIMEVGEHFLTCGDYLQGVARIRCTNSECGHDYFRPFSCKGFYLCPRLHGRATSEASDQPSCSQKRTLLFAEHLTEEVLLELPHRQFVFTFPKALRVFFRHDRRLFADISRLIFSMVQEFYHEVAGTSI